jgi:hypothetical protein
MSTESQDKSEIPVDSLPRIRPPPYKPANSAVSYNARERIIATEVTQSSDEDEELMDGIEVPLEVHSMPFSLTVDVVYNSGLWSKSTASVYRWSP